MRLVTYNLYAQTPRLGTIICRQIFALYTYKYLFSVEAVTCNTAVDCSVTALYYFNHTIMYLFIIISYININLLNAMLYAYFHFLDATAQMRKRR